MVNVKALFEYRCAPRMIICADFSVILMFKSWA